MPTMHDSIASRSALPSLRHNTPGTNIPIISEKESRAQNPDYFLVLPWHFRDEFVEREKAFIEGGGKLIFPLPEVEVYPAN